jgi:unsaturated rhamnogalacturonyl hydrolase
MKSLFLPIAIVFSINLSSFSQSNTWSFKFANAILERYKPTVNVLTNKGWEYSNSIVLHGIEKVFDNSRDSNYLKYIKIYVDNYITATGNFVPGALAPTLDKIHPGLLCLFLYKETGLSKYKTAAKNLRNYLLTSGIFNKTPDGGYWHKNDGNYNNVMMLDGIYMAETFMAKYGYMFNDTICTNTAVFQTLLMASHAYDSSTHLLKHAWDFSTQKPWANVITGCSSEAWSRGNGWYAMALVDILKYLPADHPKVNELRSVLDSFAIGIKANQNESTGLWYQVIDKQDSLANYLETSGSGMFVYALKTAVDNEWIDSSYLEVAEKGWIGLQSKIATYSDSLPQITMFAPAMTVQNNFTAYVSYPYRPVNCPAPGSFTTQHPHGYCGILMAASAMEFPITTYTFIGSDDWNTKTNWQNDIIPPTILPKTEAIVIDPVAGGNCILDGNQEISPGARIIVKKNKNLVITGNLIVH